MKKKGEAKILIFNFLVLVNNQFNKSFKIIRTDNAQEFNQKAFYESKGIKPRVWILLNKMLWLNVNINTF